MKSYNKNIISILCISDIHGNRKLAEKILMSETYDYAFSAGDTELDDEWVNTYFDYAVAGNNDFYTKLPDTKIIVLKNFTILLTHGHLFGGYQTLMNYDSLLKATTHLNKVDLFISGHTHFPIYFPSKLENKAFHNPGSITYPRFGSEHSYSKIKINVETKKILSVSYKNPKV